MDPGQEKTQHPGSGAEIVPRPARLQKNKKEKENTTFLRPFCRSVPQMIPGLQLLSYPPRDGSQDGYVPVGLLSGGRGLVSAEEGRFGYDVGKPIAWLDNQSMCKFTWGGFVRLVSPTFKSSMASS
jgi:hypothetical protein